MTAEPGLRERKKRQTREVITEAAQRLFVARGFDAVTVADVAREANVSEGTVFNYFRTKEDLFYGQMEAFEAELIEAVRDRAPGESALSAFRRFNEDRSGRLAAEDVAELIATVAPIIAASPALQAREREVVAVATNSLAAVIAEEVGTSADDVEPLVVANALMGAQRGLRVYVHAQVLGGQRGPKLAAGVRAQAKRAFARLESGLGDYAIKRR